MITLFIALQTLGINVRNRLTRDDSGATAVEYGLMVGLIAVVIIAAVTLLGTELRDMFTSVTGAL